MTDTDTIAGSDLLDRRLAGLLRHGTRVATLVIVAGIGVDWLWVGRDATLVKIGLGLFILMPIARVTMMMCFFIIAREYRFAAFAACVLAIIALGAVIALL